MEVSNPDAMILIGTMLVNNVVMDRLRGLYPLPVVARGQERAPGLSGLTGL